jgi:hypothetical protein
MQTIRFDEARRHLLVGERRWPLVGCVHHDHIIPAAESGLGWPVLHFTRQAVIAFENTWGASVIWGTCTYSDNHHHGGAPSMNPDFVEEPVEVEVGVLHRGELDGEPTGWVDAESLIALLDVLATRPSEGERP